MPMLPRLTVKTALAALLLASLLTTAARGQQVETVGTACTQPGYGEFWEQSSICPSSTSIWQRPAFQFGSAILGCTATTAGMVQWTGAALQLCNGTSWGDFSFAGSVLLGTATSATSPQKAGDATTGLFSSSATSVSIAIGGTEYLKQTSSDLNITGDIKIGSIANGYYLGGNKMLFQPANDTTSLAVGPNTLASQTITNTYHTAVGVGALQSSTATAGSNTAIGYLALNKNTFGYLNTAIGYKALYSNTTGTDNVAIGNEALSKNNLGYNVAVGSYALKNATSSYLNTAIGTYALTSLTSGQANVAVGYNALASITAASGNIAVGYNALQLSATGASYNVAVGQNALSANMTGAYNLAFGTDVGSTTLASGSYNILIGTTSAVDTPTSDTSNWLNIGNTIYGDMAAGKVGIATASPQATLDVNGYVRLAINSSQPVACSGSNIGAIAATSGYTLCKCGTDTSGSPVWVKTTDGVTACLW